MSLNRRSLVAGALALASPAGAARADVGAALPALKRAAPFPMGVAAMTGGFEDPAWLALARAQFGRVTPEWEMKMEAVLKPDGGFDFSRPDRLVAQARAQRLDVFGHTLVWYAQKPPSFLRLDGDRRAFAGAYRDYVLTMAGRYRGRVVGWDVVNEPIDSDGALRACLWSRNLGDDYIRRAFELAREADPKAALFLNDYDLESRPAKRRGFLRLAERLLKAGAPLQGLGTQTHLNADLAPGAVTAAVRDLASVGLKVHVSELDVSLNRASGWISRPKLAQRQAALVAETVEAVMALPARQRFGITSWGARDRDSWLRRPPENGGLIADTPLLFDDSGRSKASARAFVQALRA